MHTALEFPAHSMGFNNTSYILRAEVGDLDLFMLNVLCRLFGQGSCLSNSLWNLSNIGFNINEETTLKIASFQMLISI